MDLGTAVAKISLDISGLKSGASQASSILRSLDSAGANAFSGMDKALNDLSAQLANVGSQRMDIDVTQAIGGTQQLAVAIEDVEAKIDAASSSSLTIDSAEATGALQAVALAVDDVTSKVAASGGVVFGLNTTEAIAGLTQVRSEAQDAITAIQSASGAQFDVNTTAAIASLTQVATAADDVMAQLASADSATIAISVTTDQLDAASRAVQELRQTVGQNMTATVTIGGLGELDAATSQAVRTREAIGGIGDEAPSINLSGLNSDLNQAVALADQLKGSLSGLGTIGFGAGLAGLLIAPLVQGIKTAAQLEQSLKNVEVALGNVSKTDLGRLDRAIRDIGSATEYSAKEIAQVAEALAKAGYDVTDMIDGQMLPAVANLASATGSDLQTAVTGVVQAMATWSPAIVDASIAMTDASRAADILTVAANSSSADIQDIIAGMRNLGPIVSQMGVGFDEAAAAISIFTNYGMKGADAGISLARGLQNLNEPTSEAAKLMQELGIAVFDVQGKFIGFEQLFGQLSNAMRDMTEQQRFTTISLLFGAEAADAYALAVSMGVDPLVATIQAMQQQGVAAEQAAEKTNTLSGAWSRLQEATATALGGLAGGLVGPITLLATMVDGVVSMFGALPSEVQQGIGAIVGFAGALLAATTVINLTRAAMAAMNLSIGSLTGVPAAIGALRSLTTALAATRVGMAALAIATGPVGIAIAAIGAAAVVIGGIWLKQKHDAEELAKAYAELDKAIESNNKRIGDARSQGLTKLADDMEKATTKIREAIGKVTLSLAESQADWNEALVQSVQNVPDGADVNAAPLIAFFDTVWGRAALEWGKSSDRVSDTLVFGLENGFMSAADRMEASRLMDDFYTLFAPTPSDIAAIESSMEPIYELLSNPKIDQSKVWAKIDEIIANNISDGHLNLQGVVKDINEFATASNTAAGAVELMAKPFAGMTKQAQEWAYMLDDLRLKGNDVAASQIQNMDQYFKAIVTTSGDQAEQVAAAQDRLNRAIADGSVDVHAIATNFAYYKSLLDQGLISQDTYNMAISNTIANMSDFASATDDAAASQARLAKQLEDNKRYAEATGDAIAEIFRMDTGDYPLKRQL
ncbi:MAG: phage tail tape measure protein, partial [Thermomicrobiales bacterium]